MLYIINESDYTTSIITSIDDTFYDDSTSLTLATKGEMIQLLALNGWHILGRFIP